MVEVMIERTIYFLQKTKQNINPLIYSSVLL